MVPPRIWSTPLPVFVNVPVLVNRLPLPMVTMPALLKFKPAAIVKVRLFWIVKRPAAALVVK
ncbi:MAG: hypothetical protein A4E67_02397 [Syntrophaceae bacterium PtaB.Bin038]|nr:MAG: hypothetical protein A4E67_02397 [Syntrophaceae bacterium PtaB.Bin038]